MYTTSFNSTVSWTGITLTSLSNASEATDINDKWFKCSWNTRIGSNAFNSTAFTTNTGTVTYITKKQFQMVEVVLSQPQVQ